MAKTDWRKTLRALMRERGWSVHRLSKASTVPAGTIDKWLYKNAEPGIESALRVARALGVSLDELFVAGESLTANPENPQFKAAVLRVVGAALSDAVSKP